MARFIFVGLHVVDLLALSQIPRDRMKLKMRKLSSAISNTDFRGPCSEADVTMELSLLVRELGLVVEVGPSTVARGSRGLFVRLADGIEGVDLPAHTFVFGYARGSFQTSSAGDKTVGFAIKSPQTAVFFNKQLMTLEQVFSTVAAENSEVRLYGHDVMYDQEKEEIVVRPSMDKSVPRYFIPDTSVEIANAGAFIGQYCNDLGFLFGDTSEKAYSDRSKAANCVELFWRLEFRDGQIFPTWPVRFQHFPNKTIFTSVDLSVNKQVSVITRDLTFSNLKPMELGTTYGWRYWYATNQV